MSMVKRMLTPSLKRSFFLFGARGTGKSTLLKELFESRKSLWFDLLDPVLEQRMVKNPKDFIAAIEQSKIEQKTEWVVVDEIQKVPELLGYVHQLLRSKSVHFALTGSSARKLKRGSADLLAGRANYFELFPLNFLEMGNAFHLNHALNWGSLPELLHLEDDEKANYLKSYVTTYLKEEVIAEQLIRKVQPFRNFLELAALDSGRIVNYSKFGQQVGVDTLTVQNYFEILEDTLLGFSLLPFSKSVRKRQRKNPKFFFFDLGVARALGGELGSFPQARTSAFGHLFEHFVILEIFRIAKSLGREWRLSYLMTGANLELDLIIEDGRKTLWSIEIKSSTQVRESEVLKLESLSSELKGAQPLLLSLDPLSQKISKTTCLHWQQGLKLLFDLR